MPFKSQAQRGLMNAIAEGRVKRPGVSKAAAKRMVADDPGGGLPKKANSPNNGNISRSMRTAVRQNQQKNNMQGS